MKAALITCVVHDRWKWNFWENKQIGSNPERSLSGYKSIAKKKKKKNGEKKI